MLACWKHGFVKLHGKGAKVLFAVNDKKIKLSVRVPQIHPKLEKLIADDVSKNERAVFILLEYALSLISTFFEFSVPFKVRLISTFITGDH